MISMPASRRAAQVCAAPLLVLAMLAAGLAAAASPGPLYEARSERGTVYVFGSMHLGGPDFYPLPAPVYAALDESSVLLVELDLEAMAPVEQMEMMARMMLPEGLTLREQVGFELWQRVSDVSSRNGIQPEAFATMRPWAVGIVLGMTPWLGRGLSPELGIDQHMIGAARERNIDVMALETVDEQLGIFDRQTPDEAAELLEYTITQLDTGVADAYTDDLIAAWRDGDAEALNAGMEQHMRKVDPKITALLVDRRNDTMARRTLEVLDTEPGRTVMVVVGAMHLVGPRGLIQQFADAGFEVRQR